MPSIATNGKNIWIASSDGDMDRVKELIEVQGLTPNDKDENTYTPMHAAASYGHLELLDYLISKGGDINITDEDGETPIFTVESVEVARWLVEHGAKPDVQNNEGQSPAEYLFEEHPETAVYLQSLLLDPSESHLPSIRQITSTESQSESDPTNLTSVASEYQAERLSSQISDDLMAQTNEIMTRHEAAGTDPELELREIVSRAVLQGWQGALGRAEAGGAGAGDGEVEEVDMNPTGESGSKRARTD